MADVTTMRTAAETGARRAVRGRVQGASPGRRDRPRGGASRLLRGAACRIRRVEELKYTDLRAHARGAPLAEAPEPSTPPGRAVARAEGFAGIEAARLTFVNGHLVAPSCPRLGRAARRASGVTPLTRRWPTAIRWSSAQLGAGAAGPREPVYQLNTAFMADGVVISRRRRREGRAAAPSALRRHRAERLLHGDPRAGRGRGGRVE